jgi:DNA-binding NtrC family response regulator
VLNRSSVLVAEDEPFIALDLAFAIKDAGGEVIGPASSVKEALALLDVHPVVAAILDVNLVDGDISTVVEYLMERSVPLILQSGVGLPPTLVARFPDLVVRIKPTVAARLVAELATLLADRQRAE